MDVDVFKFFQDYEVILQSKAVILLCDLVEE